MDSGKIFAAVLAGIAAGLAIGLLFAPEKGSVLRGRIIDQASDLNDKVKSAAGETMDKLNKIKAKTKSSYDKLAEEVDE